MKKYNLSSLRIGMVLFALLFAFSACNKSDDANNTNSGNAQVGIRLTDGPADYDAIWLDVQRVEIITNAGTTSFPAITPGLYDLLALRNGVDVLLVTGPVPAATISQIRLILGPNNSIVVDGTSHPLNTPSAQESGLKLNLHETLVAGGSYTFWLDFDAAKSILQTGNGQYKLKPVIRAYTALTDGRIAGFVLPLASLTTVYAINGVDTFSAIPASNGYFQLTGLPSGTYSVVYDADAAGYVDVTVNNVVVNYGVTTDLGTRTIIQ